jgi:pimeloyl-ACP methyl ester carboxylesterase
MAAEATTHSPPLVLPTSIRSKSIESPAAGLTFHILEAGEGSSPSDRRPLVLLFHGFPELAYCWRKVMPGLAQAGYYTVAVDLRGYGRTIGWDQNNLTQFRLTNLVRDMVILVHALGYEQVHCVVGHDFGAVLSSLCALTRPDLFKSVVMMSHPFKSPFNLPFDVTGYGSGEVGSYVHPPTQPKPVDIEAELAKLNPPRKHYKWYNSTPRARQDWNDPPQGLRSFLRGYYHLKSANWEGNGDMHPLKEWSAQELSKLPEYYVMPLDLSMPATVSRNMEGEEDGKTCSWLPSGELDVFVQEWTRTGFGGSLNWYRSVTDPTLNRDLDLFASRKIEVPSIFISGEKDWGNYQQPGALESFPKTCKDFRGVQIIPNAGHWVQQEQPGIVEAMLLDFLHSLG